MTREWVAEQDVLFAEIGRLRQQLAEARAMYTGAQEDLNESVGIIVALRTERDYARAEARTLGQRVQEAEAELGLLKSRLDGAVLARSAAVTVIARVRELCDHDAYEYNGRVCAFTEQILAALDGRAGVSWLLICRCGKNAIVTNDERLRGTTAGCGIRCEEGRRGVRENNKPTNAEMYGEALAEIDLLRAELADAQAVSSRRSNDLKAYASRAWKAEAAIVRVRGLCAHAADPRYIGPSEIHPTDILAALDGEQT